ncbi:MAG TPA: MMPL family transporter [Candidatus Dormibacteraeota bacterium]|nr:MMPL family transporter [Candidatus Dormibacteraeota bacterium]
MEAYARFLVRRAWLVLLVVALVTVWIGLGLRQLRTEFNVESSLPAHHPLIEIDKQIRRQFGGRNTVIALIVPREGDVWRPEVLDIVQQATFAGLHLEGIMAQNVVSLAAPSVRVVDDTDGRLEVNYLMHDVPQTPEAIAALRARVEADPQFRGMLVTPDQRGAVLVLDFWDGNAGIDVAHRVLGLRDQFRDRPVDFYFAGEPLVSLTDLEQAQEMARRIPATFVVIALILLISFRNLQGMLIPMLTAVLSTIWGLGLMGHTGLVIDAWNVGTPVLLIAVAAGHSAQMLKRYIEEVERLGDNRAAVISSTVTMGPVMIAAGGVAALGFAALSLTGIPAIIGFGLACAYGIASVVVLEMTFVPALRSLLPAPRRAKRRDGLVQRVLDALEHAILRHGGRSVLIGAGIALVLAALGAAQIRTYGSTSEYMARGSLPREHLEQIQQHFPGTVTMTVLYAGPPESAKSLAELQHIEGLQAELGRDPLVWRTASLADLIKVLHRTFNGDVPDPYRLPDNQELLSQLMFLGDSPAFERFIDREYAHSLLVAYLRDDDSARVGPLVDRARAWVAAHPPPPGVEVLIAGGAGPTILAVNQHTTHTKVLNILLVLAAIYLVSSLVLRSPLSGLYVITPIAVSMVLLFGLLGWIGIRLDMGSASVLAIAAGIGADYAIYFLYRLREERARTGDDAAALHAAMQTSGRAVVFVATSIGAGFAAMGLFSRFFGLRLFGTLMPLAMAVSCIAALSLMPVLVLRTRPAFIYGRARKRAARLTEARSGGL